MVRFSLWNSHSEALRKMELRKLRQAGPLQGFFNSFNLEMNEGLKVRYNNTGVLEKKKTDLVNIKNIKQAIWGGDEDGSLGSAENKRRF